jgi:hypothetical protein
MHNKNVFPIIAGITLSLLSSLAQSAPQRGVGIVYHASDCGGLNVRSYGLGGNGAGSKCGSWGLSDCDRAIIHADTSKNWICDQSRSQGNDKVKEIYPTPDVKHYCTRSDITFVWSDDYRCR